MTLTIVEQLTDVQIDRIRRGYPLPNLPLRGPHARPVAIDAKGALYVETRGMPRDGERVVFWFHADPDFPDPFPNLRPEYEA